MKIGIIGGGFAGVAAAREAAAAAAGSFDVTVFSAENNMPYYRPRLPALACNQIDEDAIFMHPPEWYEKNEIVLKTGCTVEKVSFDCTVTVNNRKEDFDALIIASGVKPFVPESLRTFLCNKILTLWSYEDALSIRDNLSCSENLLIIGGGVIGIELALRAIENGVNVTIVEKLPVLFPKTDGDKNRELTEQLKSKGINILTGEYIADFDIRNDKVSARTGKGEKIAIDFAVISTGAEFCCDFLDGSDVKFSGGIETDNKLMTSNKRIFAAGDVVKVEEVRSPICFVVKANAQGKIAGRNAAALLTGTEMTEYIPKKTYVRLKYKDFSYTPS